jgi:Skp family chaperone for outer membrane proteins
MFRKPVTTIVLAFLVSSALSSVAGEPPTVPIGSPRPARTVRVATVNARAVLEVVCKKEAKDLQEEFKDHTNLSKSVVFQRREAAIYLRGCRELQRAVAEYCKTEGIDLVLNDNGVLNGPKANDRNDIIREMSRSFVLDAVDITPQLLKRLTAKADPAVKAR